MALKPLQQATLETFDQAFAEARRLFRERYDAEIEIVKGFRQEVINDPRKRRSLADIVEAMESLPAKAVRGNPGLERVIVGGDSPSEHPTWRGGYSFGAEEAHIYRKAFTDAPIYSLDRPDAVFETVLHEVGHAVHWMLGWKKSRPFFDASWILDPRRQGEGIWGWEGLYRRITGRVKSRQGLTGYGEEDPVEDWAETWRIMYLSDSEQRLAWMRTRLGRREFKRFRVMRRILRNAGIEVPE